MLHRSIHQLFRVFFSLVLLAGLGLPAKVTAGTASSHLFFPQMLIRSSSYHSDLQLHNPGAADATVVIDLKGPSGAATLDKNISQGGSLLVTEDDFPGLPSGNTPYVVTVSSSQPLDGVMAFFKDTTPPGLVSLFRGTSAGSDRLFFGPVYDTSFLTLLNVGSAVAAVSLVLYSQDGAVAASGNYMIAPLAAQNIFLHNLPAPAGRFLAVVSSDQPMTGMAQNTEMLAWGSQVRFREPLQPGSPALLARALRAVSELGGPRTTRVFTANTGTSAGTFTRAIYTASGGAADTGTFDLPALAYQVTDLGSLAGLADGTPYALSTTATNVATGDMTEYTASSGNISFATYEATNLGATLSLPRLLRDAGQYSVISVYNPSASMANVVINLQAQDGTVFSIAFTIPAMGSYRANLNTQPGIPAGFRGSAFISSDQPVTALVDEFYTPPCVGPAVTISHTPTGTIYPSDLVEFSASATGDAPLSYAWTLDGAPTGTDSPAFSSTLAEGGHTVGVTVTNTCGSASASDLFTVSPPPCDTPTVALAHTPSGTLYPGDTIHFTTTTSGTAPLHYAWTIDSVPAGTDSPSFDTSLPVNTHAVGVTVTNMCGSASDLETLFISCTSPVMTMDQSPTGVIYPNDMIHFTTATSGTPPFSYAWQVDGLADGTNSPIFDKALAAGNHYVSAGVSNTCGNYTVTRSFTVVEPALPQADLSRSTLNASTAGASAGDKIQFIAVLRNTGTLPSPGSLFTNQIPGYTQYVAGSARSSDGSPIAFDGTGLTWRGNLAPGSPVVITYEVTVASQPPDNQIHNTNAFLYDHLNTLTNLSSVVGYVPGYSLKINDGAVGTSSLVVDLSFTHPGAELYQISSNILFNAQDTTPWLNAQGKDTHPGWALDPLGDPRLPRTVYIRFKKNGNIVGPFTASILYDAQAPADPQIVLGKQQSQQMGARFSASLTGTPYSATTSDDNSGVAVIELSQQPDFSSGVTSVQVTGRVTDFTWNPTGPGTVYIRAIDRSGNISNTITMEGLLFVYLPTVRR